MGKEHKKANQWLIDRAYNMSIDNIDRTIGILKGIKNIKDKIVSEEQGLKNLVADGLINSEERYLKSTATGLRSYGLISGPYETTEIADKLINNEISFQNMMLLQLLKKEHKYDNQSPVIRPLVVLCSVLLKIYYIDKSLAWIDAYDYFYHLTEVKSMDDIDICVQNILKNKNSSREINYETINDFDIWISAFITAGIIVVKDSSVNKRIWKGYLNENNLQLIELIVSNSQSITQIGTFKGKGQYSYPEEKREIQLRFGAVKYGLLEEMPKIELGTRFNINNIMTNQKMVLKKFLIEGSDYKTIDQQLTGICDDSLIDGSISKLLVRSLGLNDNHVGLWKPFENHVELLKLNDEYKNLNEIYRILFERDEKEMLTLNNKRESNGKNVLYYGIPGCGKSFNVKQYVKSIYPKAEDYEKNVFRTTFYLDYSNSDFVGQILPNNTETGFTYSPIPGPFTKALKRAYEYPGKVFLIIEEINRGNAAAIFGDLFQLLDRMNEEDVENEKALGNTNCKVGDSMYPITNNFIESYLNLPQGSIIIPSNLHILATMNTSDQNVFPLDTAFKRRWSLKKVRPDWENHKYEGYYIPSTEVTWKQFVEKINNTMLNDTDGFNLEDKQIGPYFATKDMLTKDKNEDNKEKLEAFVHKVVYYIWSDIAKFNKDEWFFDKDNNRTPISFDNLVDLIDKYKLDCILPFEEKENDK